MRRLFISYSSPDRTFAETLASDLEAVGVQVWFDQWEIRVGDSIIEKISDGLERQDYLAVILTPDSVSSSWVQKELKVALMREIEQKGIVVLPVLLRDCSVPPFLSDKRYADFRHDYHRGLSDLRRVIAPQPSKPRRKLTATHIIGIDFGTRNSVAAVFVDNMPKAIPNLEGDTLTPSVVAYTGKEWLSGLPALEQAESNPDRTYFSIKTKLGTSFRTMVNGDPLDASQIASRLLGKIRTDASAYMGKDVREAVLTCPALFSLRKRQALRKAAEMAGIVVRRLIAEPTAVILAYGFDRPLDLSYDEAIAVYDLGAGSFDVSLATPADETIEVRTVGGDVSLGGDQFDEALSLHCIRSLPGISRGMTSLSISSLIRLRREVEKARIVLTAAGKARVIVPYIDAGSTEAGPYHLDVSVTRQEYERLVEGFVNRTIKCCQDAQHDFFQPNASTPATKSDRITEILLSGLASKTPIVREKLNDFYGKPPIIRVDPKLGVAFGAAIQASILDGCFRDMLLLDQQFPLPLETLCGSRVPV